MSKKIFLVLNGFLIGMLFEYTLRVELNPFVITIGILSLIQTIVVLIKTNRQ